MKGFGMCMATYDDDYGTKHTEKDWNELVGICELMLGCMGDELGAHSLEEVKGHPTLSKHSKVYDRAEKFIKSKK